MDVYARRRLVAVLAIVLVLVLIGVAVAGGGDDEQTPITTVAGASTPGLAAPLSKDDFIQQGDDICEESATAIANLSIDDTEELAGEELSITEGELDSLRSLAPPEKDQATLDEFFAAEEDLVDALDKRLLAIERGDDAAAAEAEAEIDSAKADVVAAAEDYGFKQCGKEGEATDAGTDTSVAPTDTGAVPAAPVEPAPAAPVEPAPAAPAPAPAPSGGTGSGGSGTGSGGVSP